MGRVSVYIPEACGRDTEGTGYAEKETGIFPGK